MSDQNETPPAVPAGVRDKILGAEDKKVAALLVPEWDVSIGVRTCRSDEIAEFLKETGRRRRKGEPVRYAERLTILVAVDVADRRPLFTAADEDLLAARGAAAIDRVLRLASRMNGLAPDEESPGGN